MRANNSHHIVTAARHRATATRRRAVAAIRRMDNAGQPISFDAVAREGKVSRSWLYNQPDLRAEIERLRARHDPGPIEQRLPDRQRASDASLRRRLEVATERNRQLETENRHLREALAVALGEQRAALIVGQLGDTPRKKSQPVIGPC
jgi:ATP/maltotriose-dependent transcriptional regulator MalT